MATAPALANAAATEPRRSMLRTSFVALLHLQHMALLAYLFWAMVDPHNLGLLSALVFLPPLWLAVVVLGVWRWIRVRDTTSLLLAIWGGCATPLMLVFQSQLVQAEMLPIAEGVPAGLILTFGLGTYPLVLLLRLLWWLSTPRVSGAQEENVASLFTRLAAVGCTLLIILAVLLTSQLLLGVDWFDQGAFEPWLDTGFWMTLLSVLCIGPFTLLSLLRRSQPVAISLWILTTLLISVLCYLAIYLYIAIHSAG